MKTSLILQRIFKAAGIASLFLVVLEMCARTDDWIKWDAPFLANYSYETLRVADSLGFHNRPNASFEKWHINSFGFRGPEVTMEKPPGVIRIMVAGASETFGLFESEGMDYSSQMQSILDAARPGRYQVINAGCAGMSPPRIRHYYQHWLSRFDPDLLVYYPSPGFYLDIEPPRTEFDAGAMAKWKPSHSPRIFGKAKIVLKQLLPHQLQSLYRSYMRERYVNRYPRDWVFKTPPPERLAIFDEHLSTLIDKVQNSDVTMLLATHATRFGDSLTEADHYHLDNWSTDWPRATKECYLEMEEKGNQVIKKVGDSLDIVVVDLASKVPKSDVYFFDAGHLRNDGATIVATELVAEILRLEMTSGDTRK